MVDFLSKKENSNSEVDKTKNFHNFWIFTVIISSWMATIVFVSILFFCGYKKIQFGNRKMAQKLDGFSGKKYKQTKGINLYLKRSFKCIC